jgi:2-hydroxy-4-carboxymuconate semialdehyde hemiacetal dehydrogenase
MSKTIKVALAGAGAFGIKHLDGIKNIDGVEVVSLVGRAWTNPGSGRQVRHRHVAPIWPKAWPPEVDAVILCTPTQMHASRPSCLKAGKHVQVEIPLAMLKEAQEVAELQKQTGLVAMWATPAASTPATSGCTRRSQAGEFNIQQMDVQTYFFRRTNMNALGQPAAGPTTCCGTTPPTPWTCSPTRPAAPS